MLDYFLQLYLFKYMALSTYCRLCVRFNVQFFHIAHPHHLHIIRIKTLLYSSKPADNSRMCEILCTCSLVKKSSSPTH